MTTQSATAAINRKFLLDVKKFIEVTKVTFDYGVRNLLFEIGASVIARSPVDTGHFRANWQFGEDAAPSGTVDAYDTSVPGGERGSTTEQDMQTRISYVMAGHVHYFANNLPYGEVLEYGLYPDPPKGGEGKTAGGFSRQAPYGMVRVTVAEFNVMFRSAINTAKYQAANGQS